MIGALVESERRREGALGLPVVLSDGFTWLLASPVYLPRATGLTQPNVDRPLDRLFETAIAGETLDIASLFEAARSLLLANYELSTDEVEALLEVTPGPESRRLFESVVSALFGTTSGGKSYTNWVQASLYANGIAIREIPASELLDVMSILVATNRTIPLSKFADACRELDERASLEMLI